ncbi:MAG: hypothetical protein UHS54_08355 [Lachnospiraceae bacterium]|nr:hypothetical protein [Lachnospiraceae bacterium]
MYAGGGSVTENIEKVCGKGTVQFIEEAIHIYCDIH